MEQSKEQMFTRAQLVQFGNYLFSEERRSYFTETDPEMFEERISIIHNSDIENFIESLRRGKQNEIIIPQEVLNNLLNQKIQENSDLTRWFEKEYSPAFSDEDEVKGKHTRGEVLSAEIALLKNIIGIPETTLK